MGGVSNPGGAGTWSFLSAAVNVGSATMDASEGGKAGQFLDAALTGASYGIVLIQPSITWGAFATANVFCYFYLQFGVRAEACCLAQKFGATDFFPDSGAGANYFPITQAIVPIVFDPTTRVYSLDWTMTAIADFVPVLGNIAADFRIDLIGTIANLASP